MKSRIREAAILALGVVWGCASAPTVKVGWDQNANFQRYKTWAWHADGSIKDPVWEQRFRSVLSDELAKHGLTQVDENASPDLWAVVHARLSAETQVDSYDPGWGYGWGVWAPDATVAYQIPVGTILLDLVDVGDRRAVWQGKAHGVVSTDKNNEQREEKLIAILAEMFAGYPPATTPAKSSAAPAAK